MISRLRTRNHIRLSRCRGWTMLETTSAIAIVSILLIGSFQTVATSLQFRVAQEDGLIADCLADSLFTELATLSFMDPSETTTQLGRETSEIGSSTRTNWDDIDDYHGLNETTVCYRDGSSVPNTTGWRRTVNISVNTPSTLTTTTTLTTPLRRIRIVVTSPTNKSYSYEHFLGQDSLRPSPSQISTNTWTSIEAIWNSTTGNLYWAVPLRNTPRVVGTGQ
ncbi:MAG: hypothetical protein RLY14_849 [Planctomycetota bacterium]|jgi:hypothetical protein